MTFILYSIASEKMPWLLVNITLPLIVLTGKFLGDIVIKINWRSDIYRLGFPLFILIPSVFVAVWFFIFMPQNTSDLQTFILQFVLSLIFLVSAIFVLYYSWILYILLSYFRLNSWCYLFSYALINNIFID